MSWLHNMSGAPRMVIIQGAPDNRDLAAGVVMRLADDITDTSSEAMLARLGVPAPCGRAAAAQFRKLLNERSLVLPYPPAALVTDQARGNEQEETDLLTICTVLAKSSKLLYLRDKEPNLGALLPSRRLILRIPKSWRPV